MGGCSYLVACLNGADRCVVDWNACEFGDERTLGEGYHIRCLAKLPRGEKPRDLEAVAHELDGCTMFGHLDAGYVRALREMCKRCSMIDGEPAFPRMYFEEGGQGRIWFLEFHPGSEVVVVGKCCLEESDIPPEPQPEDPEDYAWSPTKEQDDEWLEARRETLFRAIRGEIPGRPWHVSELKPPFVHDGESALATLVAMFGDRPEEAGTDAEGAMRAGLAELLDGPIA